MSRLLCTLCETTSTSPPATPEYVTSRLYFLEGKYNCADIKTKAFGNKSDAKKEQIEEFIRHKQEALASGYNRLKLEAWQWHSGPGPSG
jgi:hypothetical protein